MESASSQCTETNISYFKDSLAVKVDLGGQSLPNGRPLAHASSSRIGRFVIITWVECPGPLPQPDHLLPGSNLPVSRKIAKFKSLPLKGIAPVPKKSCQLSRNRRRCPSTNLQNKSLEPKTRARQECSVVSVTSCFGWMGQWELACLTTLFSDWWTELGDGFGPTSRFNFDSK